VWILTAGLLSSMGSLKGSQFFSKPIGRVSLREKNHLS
jgi:hypothetical protein